jgi:hypothetical protein
MVIIEKFNSKYSDIFMANSILLKERKLDPRAVIKYANANKNLVLLAVENKEPVGFIIGYSVGNKCSILTIFVQEHSRKKKIGSLLVSGLIQQNLTGLWTVRLRTIDSSIIGFFERIILHSLLVITIIIYQVFFRFQLLNRKIFHN